jgi:endonuclease/exonuclease/phosphatase family metal-dependent hydrolase
VTWNIHGCVGRDGRFDPERTAGVIRRLDPDILALQEVDSRRGRNGGLDVFDYLRKAVGEHAIDARTISTVDGHYGQLLLSRWPFARHRCHDISVPGREPRRAIEAQVELPGGRLRTIATHIGLNPIEWRGQLRALAEIVEAATEGPQLLMGDFNEWPYPNADWRRLAAHFGARTRHCTFPAMLPALALDRIWFRPPGLKVRTWAERSARRASDHLPLVAELALG